MLADQNFFAPSCTPTLADIAAWTGAVAPDGTDLTRQVESVAPLGEAGSTSLAFLDNARYAADLDGTEAAACLVTARFAPRLPARTVALVCPEPYRAFALVLARMFPPAVRPGSIFGSEGISPGAFIHPDARLEGGVSVDPGAVIGPRAEIGRGTVIGANAVIGPGVKVGRDCSVGPQATVLHALVGNRVILHAGVRIGQDGFGFVMSARGHLKVPQLGRVVIQDDVEVGANTTIDRGSMRDTVIGEGAKIDNLVQIGHNVVIGRHCVLVSQTGVSGSTKLGDFAVTAGQAGLAGHLTVGAGAQLGAQAGLTTDIPAGERWAGTPAQPARDHWKQQALLRKLARSDRDTRRGSGE